MKGGKILKPSKLFFLGLVLAVLLSFSAGICSAQEQADANYSYLTRSTQADGELKSAGADYGAYDPLQSKSFNRGVLGGGTRGYDFVTSGKSPGKRGARGAVDGVADSGSSKGNTFTTTVNEEFMRVGQKDAPLEVYKGFLSFDTSAIPYDAAFTSVKLYFYGKAKYIDGDDFDIQVVTSVYTDPLWNPDWGAFESETPRGSLPTAQFECYDDTNSISGKNIITIEENHINFLVKRGGITKIALVSSQTSAEEIPLGDEFVEIYSADATNKSLRPRLEIDYNGSDLNLRPLLTWISGDPQFKVKGVSSDTIYAGTTTLSFKVRYIYDEGDLGLGIELDPNNPPQVVIDLNNNKVHADATDLYVTMRESDPNDPDYSNGKDYEATAEITTDGSTNINYKFLFTASDGEEAVGDPALASTITTIPTPLGSDDSSSCFIFSIFPK